MNDCNYDTTCRLTLFLLWDLEHFKFLFLLSTVNLLETLQTSCSSNAAWTNHKNPSSSEVHSEVSYHRTWWSTAQLHLAKGPPLHDVHDCYKLFTLLIYIKYLLMKHGVNTTHYFVIANICTEGDRNGSKTSHVPMLHFHTWMPYSLTYSQLPTTSGYLLLYPHIKDEPITTWIWRKHTSNTVFI
jgi:hypothetical protein